AGRTARRGRPPLWTLCYSVLVDSALLFISYLDCGSRLFCFAAVNFAGDLQVFPIFLFFAFTPPIGMAVAQAIISVFLVIKDFLAHPTEGAYDGQVTLWVGLKILLHFRTEKQLGIASGGGLEADFRQFARV